MEVAASSRTSRFALCILLFAWALVFVPSPSATAGGPTGSTCTYSDGVVRVEMYRNNAHGTLDRDAAGVIYYQDHNSSREPCDGATLATTERIVVEDVLPGAFTAFFLDVSKGHFAHGGDEIPIRIDLGPSGYDAFIVHGGGAQDFWTFGRRRANLQRDRAAEIAFANAPDVASSSSRGGADHVCAKGGRGTGRPSLVVWGLDGGPRGDTLCGGNEDDHVLGGAGDDVLRGRGASDVILGGDGGDAAYGNAGEDSVDGEGGADRLRGGGGDDGFDGGPGFDRCFATAEEHVRNCER